MKYSVEDFSTIHELLYFKYRVRLLTSVDVYSLGVRVHYEPSYIFSVLEEIESGKWVQKEEKDMYVEYSCLYGVFPNIKTTVVEFVFAENDKYKVFIPTDFLKVKSFN
jgi:hypothetical protein